MKKLYTVVKAMPLLLATLGAQAQYTFSSPSPYTQDFGNMATGNTATAGYTQFGSDGTASNLQGMIVGYSPAGSTAFYVLGGAVGPNDGSNSNPGAYSFGDMGSTERALGGIAGGFTGRGYIAVRLRNNLGVPIKNLDIRYAFEQWYNSTISTNAKFTTYYRQYPSTGTAYAPADLAEDKTATTTTWTRVPELDLPAPATGTEKGLTNGNSDTYKRTTEYRLMNVNLAQSDEIIVCFEYVFSPTTNGNGMGIDDIVINPETNVLYSKTTGNLDNTATGTSATWGQNPDGSNPLARAVDFTASDVTYYVQGTNTATRLGSGSWQVTGTNSHVVVGTAAAPATLYIAPTDNITATIDVPSSSTLRIDNNVPTTTGLKLGSLTTGSTVEYVYTNGGQNVLPAAYSNLTFSNSAKFLNAGAITVGGTLILPKSITLGNYNLTMLRNAVLNRASTGLVIATGRGEYRATVIGAQGSSVPVLFPVATTATTYVPVFITAGSTDKDETYRVRAIDNVYAAYNNPGTNANAVWTSSGTPLTNTANVNTTWFISHETSATVAATLKLGWNTNKQGSSFVQGSAYIDHYSTKWDGVIQDAGATTPDGTGQSTVQRTGVSNFSPFAITSNPSSGPLPVQLVAFEAQRAGATVACTWTTASEQNNDHFVVERSLNGEDFAPLGTVAGYGSSAQAHTYTFVDKRPATGLAYYRLQQVDGDGSASYSPIVAVRTGKAATLVAVPNPSTGQFSLQTDYSAPTQVQALVQNAMGQNILSASQLVPAGPSALPLDLSGQPAGVYLVQLLGPTGPATLRLLKY
ncbi:hypothetical protein GO988_08735 [Hymenobacter sp. HMF4947]|uniref:T9SS type A sorting domain-containing protein n=1 Tax=Hymenobacter ginkgonis TaxID=2682976 RepID=A0A7K1TDD4_9BACT|nr:hypothetical protein [Hymenobacter ginkgonis]MVN76409.1 hypothetical protein [Hymenobacter ginkgonis]